MSRLSVSTMAAKARMGERTFLRRLQKATGLTPTEYVQHLRVGKARESLEFSSLAMKELPGRLDMRTMERSEECSRKSWDFRRATIGSDSAFKKIKIIANCKNRASRRSIVISPTPTSDPNNSSFPVNRDCVQQPKVRELFPTRLSRVQNNRVSRVH